jgi:GPI-anchor transamidase subunit GAA1
VVWTAINIDYPGHSFSHLGVYRGKTIPQFIWYIVDLCSEGVNGRLPNQDLINSFRVISHNAGVPVTLYDHIDPSEYPGRHQIINDLPTWIPASLLDNSHIMEYAYRARNVLKHFFYQSRGRPSGVHGLLHQCVEHLHLVDSRTNFC